MEELSLGLEAVSQLSNGIRQTRAKSGIEKKIKTEYWPSATHIKSTDDAAPSQILSFTNKHISLHGRGAEYKKFYAFLTQETENNAPSIWAVVGSGGSGKSKFAYEAVNEFTRSRTMGDDIWQKIWWNEKSGIPDTWLDYNYPCNLIVVVDYVGFQSASFSKKLARLTDNRNCKLRILLIERENKTDSGDPAWLKKLLGVEYMESSQTPHFWNFFYNTQNGYLTEDTFLALNPLNDDVLISILDEYFGEKDINRNNEIISSAKKLTRENESVSPLHLLMASTLYSSKASLNNREELFEALIEKEKKRWKNLKGELDLDRNDIEDIVLFATLNGEWKPTQIIPKDSFFENAANNMRKELFRNYTSSLFSSLGWDRKSYSLPKMTPDILGEYYALEMLERVAGIFGDDKCKNILSVLCDINGNPNAGYKDFLYRAVKDFPSFPLIGIIISFLGECEEKAYLLTAYAIS